MSSTTGRAYDMSKRSGATSGTKRRIAEAAMDLFMERDYDDVSLNDIAKAAGVSHQTVLNHFDSKAGVLPAAGEVFSERVLALEVDAEPGDPASIVHACCVRYEALGDANVRWDALSGRRPEVAEAMATGRANFQAWLGGVFTGLLPDDDEPEERRRVLLGLHAALDVLTWKLMRRDYGLSQADTERQLLDLVLGVLARHRP